MDGETLVRRYYDALDDHTYDELEEILAPEFVQRRPDRIFESRAEFVEFMREDRPNPDTGHELAELVVDERRERVAAHGAVLEDGERLFEFADIFALEDGQIVELDTYSR